MQNKLRELTDKIYNEGVQKANIEAENILANAKTNADKIINDAKKNADEIILAAQKSANEIKQNAENEIKLSSVQALGALKQQITNLLILNVVKPPVTDVFNDKDFLQALIIQVVKSWFETGNSGMVITLPQSGQNKLDLAIQNSLANELNNGLVVEFSKNLNTGFKISPADKSYEISFTDADFVNFFKAYLRPNTIKLLFGQL